MAIAINFFRAAVVPMILVLVTVLSPIIAVPIPESLLQPVAPVPHYDPDYLYKHARPHFGSSTSSLPPFHTSKPRFTVAPHFPKGIAPFPTETPRFTVAPHFPKGIAPFPTGTPRFPPRAWPLSTGPVPFPTGRA